MSKNRYIQLSHTKHINAEAHEFTTILCLTSVNQILYEPYYRFNEVRPSDEIIENLFQITLSFWTEAIHEIPVYHQIFIDKTSNVSNFRSKEGGSMLMRPIGIEILAKAYSNWNIEKQTINGFWEAFNRIDHDLEGSHWNIILWDSAAKTMAKKISSKFTREYTKYLLNLEHDYDYLLTEYTKLKGVESGDVDLLPLPERP